MLHAFYDFMKSVKLFIADRRLFMLSALFNLNVPKTLETARPASRPGS
jgi:hypothetical protein